MVVQSVSQPSPALEHDPSGIEKLSNSASSRTMESYSVIVSPVIMSSPESNRKLNLMLSTSWKEKGTDVCLFLFSITLFSMDKWAFNLAKFWSSYIEVQPTHLKPTYICVCWSTDVGTAECSCMIYILSSYSWTRNMNALLCTPTFCSKRVPIPRDLIFECLRRAAKARGKVMHIMNVKHLAII